MTSGTALPRLHLDDLLAIEIPLPPLAEQREIESYFIEQQKQRTRLARTLALGPALALESLVNSLEMQCVFEVPEPVLDEGKCFAQHRLPGLAQAVSAIGKSRSISLHGGLRMPGKS